MTDQADCLILQMHIHGPGDVGHAPNSQGVFPLLLVQFWVNNLQWSDCSPRGGARSGTSHGTLAAGGSGCPWAGS